MLADITMETHSTIVLLIMSTLQGLPMPMMKRHIMAASTMKNIMQTIQLMNITMTAGIMQTIRPMNITMTVGIMLTM
ncbi:hypothetical protein DPMN_117754 [Dreissena polymorpha]|uniref:Uncharacterized protein n=1 Tax=Dreissena polymorpha TaxID=45954 RepID=A0A9D4GFA1_DREPO|nr:hypothetical protein DPMN_117754 [Dreissena polymorpha]